MLEPLRNLLARDLSRHFSVFRTQVLIAESEELDVTTFLARLPIWLKLAKLKRGDSK
jgi:hypothetical protein